MQIKNIKNIILVSLLLALGTGCKKPSPKKKCDTLDASACESQSSCKYLKSAVDSSVWYCLEESEVGMPCTEIGDKDLCNLDGYSSETCIFRSNKCQIFGPFDARGFDSHGIHQTTRTRFDKKGYDLQGFNANGTHKDTNTKFAPNGLDKVPNLPQMV